MSKKVLLGMSGGVDSSVSVLLLKEMGYDVTGATLKLCEKPPTDIDDAKAVSEIFGINHIILDFKEIFHKKVIKTFISEYINGKTPNPCVVCNKNIKFGKFLDYALENGFDYVATGHYANVIFDVASKRYLLKKSKSQKDQSYVLYHLSQHQLKHIIFPISDREKFEIRKIAEKHGLSVAQKHDSQEICFIQNHKHIEYIKNNIDKEIKKGNFVDINGKILSVHDGIINYTIGQRRGLRHAFGKHMYVVKINPQKNEITLGDNEDLYTNFLVAKDVNFIPFDELTYEIAVTAKLRYKAQFVNCNISPLKNEKVFVKFESPQRAITAGQSVVFYDNNIVVGGGVIETYSI